MLMEPHLNGDLPNPIDMGGGLAADSRHATGPVESWTVAPRRGLIVVTADGRATQPEVVSDRLAELVVRSMYARMVGRPVNEVYRAVEARLRNADVDLPSERIRQYALSISDGTFELRR
jgi:hypothetical protein